MNEISHASWCESPRTTLDAEGLFHECRSAPARVMDVDRQSVRVGMSQRPGTPALVTLEAFRLSPAVARQLASQLSAAADAAESG